MFHKQRYGSECGRNNCYRPIYTEKNRDELELISANFDLKYILALLNSKLFSCLFNSLRTQESFDINPEVLKKLPILQTPGELQKEYINLVDVILEITMSEDYQ